MGLCENIKVRRLSLDMTLEEVAKVVGVTRQTILKYENGIISNIPSDKIELLAKALRTSPAYLMGWADDPAVDGDGMDVAIHLRLKNLREDAGFKSQYAFAEAFGVAQSTVAGWEGGKREPNYTTTIRLADFFGVSVDYLLGHQDSSAASPLKAEIQFSPSERQILELYRMASPDDQAVIDAVLRKYKTPSSKQAI